MQLTLKAITNQTRYKNFEYDTKNALKLDRVERQRLYDFYRPHILKDFENFAISYFQKQKQYYKDPTMVFLGSLSYMLDEAFTKIVTGTDKGYPAWWMLFNNLALTKQQNINTRQYNLAFKRAFDAVHGRGTFQQAKENNKRDR